MAGPYCPRCQTSVKLEQDGKSCSNCGRVLMIPAPDPPHVKAAKKRAAARSGRRKVNADGGPAAGDQNPSTD